MSYGTLVVNSWVAIHEGCDMTYNVSGSNDMCVAVSSRTHLPFEFYFQGDALRQFIELGRKALAEMDALVTQEEAEQDAHIPATLER